MPIPNTLVTFTAGQALPAADLNANFANIDYLDAKINEEIQVDAASMDPRETSGAVPSKFVTGTNPRNYRTMDFADGSQSFADFQIVLPSDYDGGTVTAEFYWTANSTSTNSVVWGLGGVAIADDGTLDVAVGTAQQVADANKSTAYDLNVSDATAAITIAGTPAAGKLAYFTVYRLPTDASDTLAATARLLKVVINYTRA